MQWLLLSGVSSRQPAVLAVMRSPFPESLLWNVNQLGQAVQVLISLYQKFIRAERIPQNSAFETGIRRLNRSLTEGENQNFANESRRA